MVVRQPVTAQAEASVTYPGTPASVAAVRRFVRETLAHCPRVDDLELIASELVTNAIRHTPSGQHGGTFTITIRHQPGAALMEIADLGIRPWHWAPRNGGNQLSADGRGLQIVTAVADQVGHRTSRGHHQITWARLTW
jgi:serine/threonine-protein kinase RsbW